jgi:hypothetical protein
VPRLVAAVLLAVPYVCLDILVASVLPVFAFEQLDGLVLPWVREEGGFMCFSDQSCPKEDLALSSCFWYYQTSITVSLLLSCVFCAYQVN